MMDQMKGSGKQIIDPPPLWQILKAPLDFQADSSQFQQWSANYSRTTHQPDFFPYYFQKLFAIFSILEICSLNSEHSHPFSILIPFLYIFNVGCCFQFSGNGQASSFENRLGKRIMNSGIILVKTLIFLVIFIIIGSCFLLLISGPAMQLLFSTLFFFSHGHSQICLLSGIVFSHTYEQIWNQNQGYSFWNQQTIMNFAIIIILGQLQLKLPQPQQKSNCNIKQKSDLSFRMSSYSFWIKFFSHSYLLLQFKQYTLLYLFCTLILILVFIEFLNSHLQPYKNKFRDYCHIQLPIDEYH